MAFAAPAGLVVTPQVVTLDADDGAAVSVRILNAGLPVGSRVPVVAVAEYDTPEEHRTVTAVSMVEIVEPGDGSRLGVTALLLGATLLAWVVIVAVAAARRRHAS